MRQGQYRQNSGDGICHDLIARLDTMYDEISSKKIFKIEFPIGSR